MTTKRNSKRNGRTNGKHANNTPKPPGVSGRNGLPPPEETKWKPGQPSPNPHGRPKKLRDLQELIIATLAENAAPSMTRAQLMVRAMILKNPVAILEYAFGKLPQTNINIDGRTRVIQLLREGRITQADVIAELGHDLATELFESAGIAVAESVSAGAESEPTENSKPNSEASNG